MSPSNRISLLRRALMPVMLFLGVAAAAAQPALATPTSHTLRPDQASAAVRQATVSSEVQHATGYSPSQLSTRAACGSAPAGAYRCYARVLTLRSTGRAAAPLPVNAVGPATSAPAAYTAAFLQSAYDTIWLSANEGANDTVAIVDAYGDSGAYTDMEQFRTTNGLPQIPTCSGTQTTECFELVNQNGQTSNLPTSANDETGSWNVEESLDIDAVSAICPLCKIVMVEADSDDYYGSPDLETAVATAARLGANQISLSWGADQPADAADNESPYSTITGAAILAAAGDGSYPGPDVGYPAALPSVTALGGTTLTSDATAARGYAESAWSVETCSDGSICATESGCDRSQSVPSYQGGIDTGCSGRAYNDISADADPSTGLEIYDSRPSGEGCGTRSNWCIVGGTSLATPLTAALEGVTGVSSATTPAWTYTDASLLNDIVSGSDGTCPSGWSLICDAATGWDGPTGNGSINGDLATGGPGIGGNDATGSNATDVTFTGGLYPNGESTSYHWLYWPSSQTVSSAASAGTGTSSASTLQGVAATICNTLTPSTTYDYELVAANSSASTTGYQGSFRTSAIESAPTTSSAPTISGSTLVGQTLAGTDATWNDAPCDSASSYAWQESPTGGAPWTTVGSGLTYTLSATDTGQFLRFTATQSNSAGATTVASQTVGRVTEPGATSTSTSTTTTTTTPTTPTPTTPTSTTPTTPTPADTTPTGGTPTDTTPSTTPTTNLTTVSSTSVRFYRCAVTCKLLRTHGAKTYRPRRADYGRYIKVVTTVARVASGVETDSTSTRWVGPVTAATAGDVGFSAGARVASATIVRGTSGRALAQVRVTRHHGSRLTVVVRRRGSATTAAWAYVVAHGRVISGTRTRSLNRPLTLSFALKRGQTVRLVAVRT